MPILSEDEIVILVGWSGKDEMRNYLGIAKAAAEACAKLCEEVGRTRLAEFHDAPRMADGCAGAIREAAT